MAAAIPAYRSRLPQLDREVFLTDGGIETTLIFHEGIDLPLFAACGLLGSDEAGPACGGTSTRMRGSPASRTSATRRRCSTTVDPDDLAARYVGLRERFPNLSVLGGCCGTDDRHVRAMGEAWLKA
jgi:S-methylmethionine-dependent homocysteine/selenocysteine methylase